MKNQISFTVLTLVAAFCLFACKKTNQSPAKDYAALLKNSTWTGEFSYTGKAVQPVSISFNENGQLVWYEWSGEFTGTWKVDHNTLTVTSSNSGSFNATISDDNQLTGIQTLANSSYTMINGTMQTAPNSTLDNTVWTGLNIIVKFKPGNLLDLQLGSLTNYNNVTYVQKANTIRFTPYKGYTWFVINSGGSPMKGANQFLPDLTIYTFQLSK